MVAGCSLTEFGARLSPGKSGITHAQCQISHILKFREIGAKQLDFQITLMYNVIDYRNRLLGRHCIIVSIIRVRFSSKSGRS